MALLSVTPITKFGIANMSAALVATDPTGDSVDASSGIFLFIENAGIITHTVTVAKPSATTDCGNLGSLVVEDLVVTIAVDDNAVLAIPLGYTDANGKFSWTYDTELNVNIGVFSLAP